MELEEVDLTPTFEDPSLNQDEENNNEEHNNDIVDTDIDQEDDYEQDQNESFEDFLKNTYGWEVPKNVDAKTTVKQVVESYSNIIEELQQQIEELSRNRQKEEYEPVKELEHYYYTFKSLPQEEAVKDYLIEVEGYDEEDANDELNDLIAEGKLNRKHKLILKKIEQDYLETKEEIEQQYERELEIREREEELQYQQQVTSFIQEVETYDSDLFDVSKKDKEFIKEVFLNRQEDGTTMFENIINNPKSAISLVLAYVKAENLKSNDKLKEKKIANKLVNQMANEPIFNSKLKSNNNQASNWGMLEEL